MSCQISISPKWNWDFLDSGGNVIKSYKSISFSPRSPSSTISISRSLCEFDIDKSAFSDIPANAILYGFFSTGGGLYIDCDLSFKYCAYQVGPVVNGKYQMRSQDCYTNSLLYPNN